MAKMSDDKMRRPQRAIVVFFSMAMIGTNLELISRALSRDLVPKPGGCAGTYDCSALANFVCCQNLKVASAVGWTSLWMWLVYGFAGVLLGRMNHKGWLVGRPMLLHAVVGTALSLAIEFTTGLVFNGYFGLQIWDYGAESFHFYRLISVRSALCFFSVAPFAFWLDDVIGWMVYHERRPQKLRYYYTALFSLSVKPAKQEPTRGETAV